MPKITAKNAKTVAAALTRLAKQSKSIPTCQYVEITATPDALTFTGTDLGTWQRWTVPTVERNGWPAVAMHVDVHGFAAAVKNAKGRDATVAVDATGDKGARITAGGMSVLLSPSTDPLPDWPVQVGGVDWELDTDSLRDVLHARGTDPVRPVLTGVHVATGELVATDSYRLATAPNGSHDAKPFTLTGDVAAAAGKHYKGVVAGQVDPTAGHVGRVRLSGDVGDCHLVIVGALESATFPDYRQLIPDMSERPTSWTFLDGRTAAKALRGMLPARLAGQVPGRFTAGDGKVVAAIRNPDGPTSTVDLTAQIDGPDVGTVAFNTRYFADMVDVAGPVTVRLVDQLKPVVSRWDGRVRLLMPVRL